MDNAAIQARFFHLMQRFRRLRPLKIGDLHGAAFFLLELLHDDQQENPDSEGMYGTDIAMHTHMSPPAISRMLRALEAKGYVSRIPGREDRRNTHIRLTPEGSEALSQAQAHAFAFVGNIIEKMGPEATLQLLQLLERLSDIIEEDAQNTRERKPGCSNC